MVTDGTKSIHQKKMVAKEQPTKEVGTQGFWSILECTMVYCWHTNCKGQIIDKKASFSFNGLLLPFQLLRARSQTTKPVFPFIFVFSFLSLPCQLLAARSLTTTPVFSLVVYCCHAKCKDQAIDNKASFFFHFLLFFSNAAMPTVNSQTIDNNTSISCHGLLLPCQL